LSWALAKTGKRIVPENGLEVLNAVVTMGFGGE